MDRRPEIGAMRLFLLFFAIVVIIGVTGCITDTRRPSASHEIVWIGTQPDSDLNEYDLLHQITPYPGTMYDNITVNASDEDGKIRLHVRASSRACRYPDRYDFTYQSRELVLNGYILEAIPESVRSDAVRIAMQNEEIADMLEMDAGGPTVKRILPETAAKFYAPEMLLSVTWQSKQVSALVDINTRKVVKTWRGE